MIHATGKVATTIVDALKTQPVALPVVVVNLICMVVVGFVLYEIAERARDRDKLILDLAKNCQVLPKGAS